MDIRVALTLWGAALIVAVWAALWVDRRLRRTATLYPSATELFDSLPQGLLLLDAAGLIRYANPHASRLLRLPPLPQPLPDQPWAERLQSEIGPLAAEATDGRLFIAPFDENRTMRWWVGPWEAWQVVMVEDVTDQHQSTQTMRLLMSDLSHELRTPLAALLTHLEIMRLPDIPTAARAQSLALMQGEVARMTRMVQALLALGWLESGNALEQHRIEMLPFVEGLVAQVQPQAEVRQLGLAIEAATPLPPVLGDRDRVRQLFLILLDNAIKYSRPGDRVTIHLHAQHDGIACTVCDTGAGIPAEALPQLTRRFYRANRGEDQPGSGLGLALAAEIVRRHGGHLDIESRTDGPDHGTCVRFVLPSATAKESEP